MELKLPLERFELNKTCQNKSDNKMLSSKAHAISVITNFLRKTCRGFKATDFHKKVKAKNFLINFLYLK